MSFVRAAALLTVLGFPLLATGCSGSSGATPLVPPSTTTTQDSLNPAPLGTGSLSVAPSNSTVMATAAAPSVQTAAATPGVRTHIMTAGMFWGYGGTPTSVPLSAAQTWLTWAMTSSAHVQELRSAGVKIDSYVNFWRNYTTDYPKANYYDIAPGGAHAAAAARTCSGTVIRDSTYGGGYEADARSSATVGHAKVVIGQQSSDAVFSDDTGALGGLPLPCGFSVAGYQAATNAVHAALPYKMFLNTLGAGRSVVEQVGYATAPNVLGAMCELCITANGPVDVPRLNGVWTDTENAEIKMAQIHKIYWLYARASGPATEYQLRNYTIASFLLAYEPDYAMLQEVFKTPSGFEVFPEAGLVPMNPRTTATNVSGYLQSNGTYMREYGNCYYRGVLKGKCAVVVNPTSYSKSVPATTYGHAMVLSGYGVQDGGTVSFSGGRPSSLPSGSGVVLFP